MHATAAELFAAFVTQIITRAPEHLPALAQAVALSEKFFAPIQSAYDPILKFCSCCAALL